MALLPAPRLRAKVGLLLLAAAVAMGQAPGSTADYQTTTTGTTDDFPEWVNTLQLNLSTSPGQWLPQQYTVIPVTQDFTLAELGRDGEVGGVLDKAVDTSYNDITTQDVAYLSCDEPEQDTNIGPDKMLNDLMDTAPQAIVLYSTTKNWCSLSQDSSLKYSLIFSMVDPGDASAVLRLLNGTSSNHVRVAITGNATDIDPNPKKLTGGNSTVAMSVLYSITGIISLLFIVIISTGAVRAHRYPDRYGPRRAFGGRARQSRAKGLARAVLETLPIVKFSNQERAKPDPDLELETATTDGQEAGNQRAASVLSEDRQTETAAAAGEGSKAASTPNPDAPAGDTAGTSNAHLGCSICTEDFEVGEDVRVLPCSHQFHPNCIDPWLVNVSGTCPLCRLDLHPGKGSTNGESAAEGGDTLPPPLALEGDEATTTTHRNRLSRIFDINRLRQATAEEQMEALRQMRTQGAEPEPTDTDGETRHQSTRFADKLKEKFRIRTRAQTAERQD